MFRLRTAQKKFRNIPFSPSALFQTGDILLWYDPSDLTTLFQDTAGTTPVTADGQSVALQLDKGQWGGKTLTQVLAAQPELIDATAGAIGATVYRGTQSALTGRAWRLETTSLSGFVGFASGSIDPLMTNGVYYEVEVVVHARSVVNSSVRIFVHRSTAANSGLESTPFLAVTGVGTFRAITSGTSTLDTLTIATVGGAGAVVGDTWDIEVSVKEIPGYHRIQATGTSMPKYKTDGTLHWLLYDGSDDGNVTPSINWGTDEVAICAGLTKSSDAATGMAIEFSPSVSANAGAFYIANSGGTANWSFNSRGAGTAAAAIGTTGAAPNTTLLTAQSKISTDSAVLRGNGAQIGSSALDQGSGNFGNYPIYFGRRGGSTLPVNGKEYQTVIRNRLLSAAELASLETFVAGKTGIIL